MKRYLLNGLLVSLMLVSTAAVAELKLGYVNAALLLDKAPQAQQAATRMKEEFGSRESTLIAGKRKFDDMQARLGRDGSVMSDAQRKQLRLDIVELQRNLARDEEALRQDVAIRRSDVIASLQGLIRAAIDVVGKKGKYSLIFYDGIAYADSALDITDQVLEDLKKSEAKAAK